MCSRLEMPGGTFSFRALSSIRFDMSRTILTFTSDWRRAFCMSWTSSLMVASSTMEALKTFLIAS